MDILGNFNFGVAPYMGAWIEIKKLKALEREKEGRTLHGCVDWNPDGKIYAIGDI